MSIRTECEVLHVVKGLQFLSVEENDPLCRNLHDRRKMLAVGTEDKAPVDERIESLAGFAVAVEGPASVDLNQCGDPFAVRAEGNPLRRRGFGRLDDFAIHEK